LPVPTKSTKIGIPHEQSPLTLNNHLWPQFIEHKKTTTYGVGNPGPSLRQTQNCGGVKLIKCYVFLFNHVLWIHYYSWDTNFRWFRGNRQTTNLSIKFKVRGDCSFCGYWWNSWPSMYKHFFHEFTKITLKTYDITWCTSISFRPSFSCFSL
jgi:hypothetical protein